MSPVGPGGFYAPGGKEGRMPIQNKNIQPNITGDSYAGLDSLITKSVKSADPNPTAGFKHTYLVSFADGATESKTIVLPAKGGKCKVIDVTVIKTAGAGGASDTIQVFAGATAVTDAIDMNVADKTVKRAATIDDAAYTFADAATITVTKTKASANNMACEVYVEIVRSE